MLRWDSACVQGYLHALAWREARRFRGRLDADDLMQEFMLSFLTLIDKVDPARGDAAMMCMLKRRVWWRINDLKRELLVRALPMKRTAHDVLSETRSAAVDEDSVHDELAVAEILEDALQEAPVPLQLYVRSLVAAGHNGQQRPGENLPERVRRVTGMSKTWVLQLLREWQAESLMPRLSD